MATVDTANEGVVWETRTIKEFEGSDRQYKFKVGIGFKGAKRSDLEKAAFGYYWIRLQRVLREAGHKKLEEVESKGSIVVHYSECGMKIKSDDDRRDEMIKQYMIMRRCSYEQAKKVVVKMLEAELED